MSSAELLPLPLEAEIDQPAGAAADARTSQRQLQQQAAERIAAHRQRRGLPPSGASLAIVSPAMQQNREANAAAPTSRTARIASAVAERYAHSQSYRDFLAAEAQRAIDEANAAAEVAARSAATITAMQQQFIADLEAESERHSQPSFQAEAANATLAEANATESYLWPDAAILRPATQVTTPRPTTSPKERAKPTSWVAPSYATIPDPAKDLFTELELPANNPTAEQTATHSVTASPLLPITGLSVRLYEQAEYPAASLMQSLAISTSAAAVSDRYATTPALDEIAEEESRALDEEIAFRQTPVFDDPPSPVVPIPGNLLEFPRQLVAARKARPRLAEGPLRPASEGEAPTATRAGDIISTPATAQLRIFEVDPAQISPEPPVESLLPEWSSIHLDAPEELTSAESLTDLVLDPAMLDDAAHAANRALLPTSAPDSATDALPAIYAATVSLRVMAAMVDLCLITLASIGLVAIAAVVSGSVPVGLLAAVSAIGISGALFVLYQILFFTFSDCTPGMRYARIAFCTFADENPTRRQMRARIPALILSVCPAALGLLWIALDPNQLGFHDRMTKMYQRSY